VIEACSETSLITVSNREADDVSLISYTYCLIVSELREIVVLRGLHALVLLLVGDAERVVPARRAL
jgi:hypothetical protein